MAAAPMMNEADAVVADAMPLPLPPARDIPSTFFSSVKSWWALLVIVSVVRRGLTSPGGPQARRRALQVKRGSWGQFCLRSLRTTLRRSCRKLPYFRSSFSPASTPPEDASVVAHSTRVELSEPKSYINTFAIESTKPAATAPPPAVVLHGYGDDKLLRGVCTGGCAKDNGQGGLSTYGTCCLQTRVSSQEKKQKKRKKASVGLCLVWDITMSLSKNEVIYWKLKYTKLW